MGAKWTLIQGATWLHLTILILSTLGNVSQSTPIHEGGSSRHTNGTRVHFVRMIESSARFSCREPQSRAYNLRNLTERHYQNSGLSANRPVYIVLKRCDEHAGCCTSPDMSCGPVPSSIYYEDVEIEVLCFTTMVVKRQWIRVEQHGKCKCQLTTPSERYQLKTDLPEVSLPSSR